MSKNINARIALKRDTSANWTNYNPVLLDGELILVDTDNGLRAKIGDGTKTYTQLPFTDEALRALITDVDDNNSAVVMTKDGESQLLDTFNVIKLTQEEYDELKASNSLDPDALYLTEPLNLVNGSAEGSLRSIYSNEESNSYIMGDYAVALGRSTAATGQGAHAEGRGTTASGDYSHVQGRYNIEDVENKYAHIVGNGEGSGDRTNAHTLDWDGVGWFAGGLRVGGTSQDDGEEVALLNNNGIIKQEHLPDGFPYSEFAEILPSETIEIDPDAGMGFIGTTFALVVGGEYTVTWNGTEYSCIGQEYSMDSIPAVAIGNIGAITGGDATEEPFVIINFDADTAAALGGVYGVLIALDGSASATIAISGTQITKISAAYLPKMGISNIVDGSSVGSLRQLMAAEESDEYTIGFSAVAFGFGTKASGDYSHAEGNNTTASGVSSHAEGEDTTASDNGSHAEGGHTIASGVHSHAEGSTTTASGQDSHAEGQNTTASGYNSHAEGGHTTASGRYSHVEGGYTIASGDYQHVQGKHNVEDTADKYAHIVGNGSVSLGVVTRSNAHTLDWDGNAWFAGDVYVGGTSQDDGDRLIRLSEQMTEDDALELLAELNVVDPITNENGAIFTDENGAIYVL